MSDVNQWLCGLGKAFSSCADTFHDNGVDDFSTLAILEVDDMVKDFGLKKAHAKIIYHKYRKDFLPEECKSEPLASEDEDDETIDLDKVNVFEKELKSIFMQNDGFFEKLIKIAKVNSIVTDALDLLYVQLNYIKELQRKPLKVTHMGFLSHVQKNSGDLCRSLHLALIQKDKEAKVWYDMNAGRLDARGMADGICSSGWFVLIASKDYFLRPWPIYEVLLAQILCKPIIVAVDTCIERGGLSFNEFHTAIPKPWKFLIDHEWIEIKRRGALWSVTVDQIHRRLKRPIKESEHISLHKDAGDDMQKVPRDEGTIKTSPDIVQDEVDEKNNVQKEVPQQRNLESAKKKIRYCIGYLIFRCASRKRLAIL